jgi:hypothetical protein
MQLAACSELLVYKWGYWLRTGLHVMLGPYRVDFGAMCVDNRSSSSSTCCGAGTDLRPHGPAQDVELDFSFHLLTGAID